MPRRLPTTVVASLVALTAAAREADLDAAREADLDEARGRRVRDVRIEGLRWTRPESLRAFTDTRPGEAFDPDRLRADLVRLGNLELFEEPSASVTVREGEVDVVFHLADKWTLLPYLKFVRGGGSTQVILGLYDVNVAGLVWELGGEYRYFNGHPAGDFFTTLPRPWETPFTFAGEALVETTGRTAYEGRGIPVYEYVIDRRRASAGVDVALRDWLHLGGAYGFERDGFAFASSSPGRDVLPPDGDTGRLGARLVLGQVRFHDDYRESGSDVAVEASASNRYTGSDFDLRTFEAAWRGFVRLGTRMNLAARAAAGRTTGDVQFQHEFVLGALATSRGFLDDQFRGRRYVAGSVEYRVNLLSAPMPIFWRAVKLLRGRPLQFQGVLFSDAGAYDGSRNYARDHAADLLLSFGAGARAIIRPFYRAVLRVDVARTVSPFDALDVVVGTQQFF